jgi:hypothetical protein
VSLPLANFEALQTVARQVNKYHFRESCGIAAEACEIFNSEVNKSLNAGSHSPLLASSQPESLKAIHKYELNEGPN